MDIVHSFPLQGSAVFGCAQAGCRVCLDALMRRHEGLVHYILRRQVCGDAAYDDLLQEGRIGLWQAILHFDPQRGAAFSTYAGVAIQRRIWRAAKQTGCPQGEPLQAAPRTLEAIGQRFGVTREMARYWRNCPGAVASACLFATPAPGVWSGQPPGIRA